MTKDPLATNFSKSNTRKVFPHSVGITRLAYSSDGNYLFTVGSNSVVYRLQPGTDELPLTISLQTGNSDEDSDHEEENDSKQYGITASVCVATRHFPRP